VFGTRLVLPEGSSSLIEIPSPRDNLIAGLKHGAELQNARCMFHVSSAEIGDGWVVLKFLPQIHYGGMSVRYSLAESGEQLPVRQRIQPLYEQQFELKLHTGETAVIGYQKQDDWSVGQLMFQRESLSSLNEQVVTIELAAVEAIQGQKSVTIRAVYVFARTALAPGQRCLSGWNTSCAAANQCKTQKCPSVVFFAEGVGIKYKYIVCVRYVSDVDVPFSCPAASVCSIPVPHVDGRQRTRRTIKVPFLSDD